MYGFKQKLKVYEKLRFDFENVKPEVDVSPKNKSEVEFKKKSKPLKICYPML